MINQCRIAIIGAGNMGAALLRGVVSNQQVPVANITACDIDEAVLLPLEQLGVRTTMNLDEAVVDKHVVVLAVKPQIAFELIDRVSISSNQLVLSIMAGVTTASIELRFRGEIPVVRSMPQLLAFAGVAATAICPGKYVGKRDLDLATDLFDQVGSTVLVDEDQMDAVTGLSGSGPAYVYSIIEALVEGGVAVGLPADVATTLAAQTVLGAAHTVLHTGEKPKDLRTLVTSPNGTTMAGLRVLEDKGLTDALVGAVKAATARSRELGQ